MNKGKQLASNNVNKVGPRLDFHLKLQHWPRANKINKVNNVNKVNKVN